MMEVMSIAEVTGNATSKTGKVDHAVRSLMLNTGHCHVENTMTVKQSIVVFQMSLVRQVENSRKTSVSE
jgi:hypothetical protein